MKNKRNTKLLTLILNTLLLLSVSIFMASCSTSPQKSPDASASSESATELKSFVFTVVDAEGNETMFDIETDKEIVGDALLAQGLIEGEEGQYGLYVKTVNGILADYNITGTYWAFYINGEYATSGVDTTPIKEGETYTFKVEKS